MSMQAVRPILEPIDLFRSVLDLQVQRHHISFVRQTLLVRLWVNIELGWIFLSIFLTIAVDADELIYYVLSDEHHDTPCGLGLHTEVPVGYFSQHDGRVSCARGASGDHVFLQVPVFGNREQDYSFDECEGSQLQIVLHLHAIT